MPAFARGLAAFGLVWAVIVADGADHQARATGPVYQSGDTIKVYLDQAKLLKLPDGTATLVVGNPLIADVAVQSGGTLVVTGKGYGNTNLIALDRSGSVIMEHQVEVQGPQGTVVVVYRGVQRESYSCTPNCERRITLGDTQDYFAATLGQSGTLNAQAQGGGQQQQQQQQQR
jgi:Flp pilus assembly secretin CpaC